MHGCAVIRAVRARPTLRKTRAPAAASRAADVRVSSPCSLARRRPLESPPRVPPPGAVERPFSTTRATRSRGLPSRGRPRGAAGTPVRAACSGRVTFAGRGRDGGVAVRCGRLARHPLAAARHRSARASAGRGRADRHRRRARTSTGPAPRRPAARRPARYVDPAPHAPPAPADRRVRRTAPAAPPTTRAVASGARGRRRAPARAGGFEYRRPWPAWAGLAPAAGAAGAGTAARRRPPRAHARAARCGEPMSASRRRLRPRFFVAAQLGPLSLFAIRSTLRAPRSGSRSARGSR